MGPDKKKNPVDDLFDDLADSFFRSGDEGAVEWDELPATVEIKSTAAEAEAPPPEPPAAPPPAPPAPVVAAEPPPAPVAAAEPPPTPSASPFATPYSPPPSSGPRAPAPSTARSALANEATQIFSRPLVPGGIIPAPAARPGDNSLFSAPTVIMPAAPEADEEPQDEPSAPPVEPELAQVSLPPSRPVQGLDMSDEESLFFSASDERLDQELLDQPTAEAPLHLRQAAEAGEELGLSDAETAVAPAGLDDDDEEAMAEDFMDAGPDHSLVLRRAPKSGGAVNLGGAPMSAPVDDLPGYSEAEIAAARAERDSRRQVVAAAAALDDDWFAAEAGTAAPPRALPPTLPPVLPAAPAPLRPAALGLQAGLNYNAMEGEELGVFDEETAVMEAEVEADFGAAPAEVVSAEAPVAEAPPAEDAPVEVASAEAPHALPAEPSWGSGGDESIEADEASMVHTDGFAEREDLSDLPVGVSTAPAALDAGSPAEVTELGPEDFATEAAPGGPSIAAQLGAAALGVGAAAAALAAVAGGPTAAQELREVEDPALAGRASPVPSAGAAAWEDAARALEAEAEVRPEAERGPLRVGAGLIYFHRAADWAKAGPLLGSGGEDAQSSAQLAAFTDVVAEQRDHARLLHLLERRAAATAGPEAGELLQDAAMVVQAQDPSEARRLLRASLEALEATPEHPARWFGLQRLAALCRSAGADGELMGVLEQMIELSTGARRGRLLADQARLLASDGASPERLSAVWAAARAADPSAPEPTLALEALARATGDAAGLVALYREEAARTGEQGWWLARAVRAAAAGQLDPELIRELWAALRLSGALDEASRREEAAWLESTGQTDALEAVLTEDAAHLQGAARSAALCRIAELHERRGDEAGALSLLRSAVELDPSNAPAVESAARLLRRSGQYAQLVELLGSRLDELSDPNLVVHTLYRIGEINEGLTGDLEAASAAYERILGFAPGYLPALDGLERVLHRLGAWAPLAALYEQRASLADDPAQVAMNLQRAGGVHEDRLSDADRATEFYLRALELSPELPTALDAAVRLLTARGETARVAALLRAAGNASRDPNTVVSHLYRSARLLVDQRQMSAEERADAVVALSRCAELSPGFLPALTLLRDLAAENGAAAEVYELHRLEADSIDDPDRRAWRLLAAAEAASQLGASGALDTLRSLLEERPGWAPAVAYADRLSILSGDAGGRLGLLRSQAAGGAAAWSTLADLSLRNGDQRGALEALLRAAEVEPSHHRGLALLAAALQDPAAGSAICQAADPLLSARLLERADAPPQERLKGWRRAAALAPAEAAAGLERALDPRGDRAALAEVHAELARVELDPAVRGVHALLAGRLYEGLEDLGQAQALYALAFGNAPTAGKAMEGLRRTAVANADTAALLDAHAQVSGDDSVELALDLEACGAHAEAAAVWRRRAEGADEPNHLVCLVHIERNLAAIDDWSGVFEALSARAQRTQAAAERLTLHQRRRWVLAEKLASTDLAWDHYRQLHAEQPNDPEVVEALARIAAARGETELSLRYLGDLAQVTEDGPTAARYHRRVAEVHLQSGDRAQAREALSAALQRNGADLDALSLLTQLAEEEGDHRALVALVARRANLTAGEEQVETYRRIARIWADDLREPAVALGAWRKVLELAPHDPSALRAVVALSREAADWTAMVQAAAQLIPDLVGAERTALQAEVGAVYLRALHREDEALRFLDAASAGEAPSLAAAVELERIYAAKGAWDRVVDAKVRQSRAAGSDAERAALLLQAAQIRLVNLMDRSGAAELYGEVLKVEPANATALTFRADHLYASGDLGAAAGVFADMEPAQRERDLDDFDDRIEVALYYYRFAEALRHLGRTGEAMQRYSQSLELNPNHLPSLEAAGPLFISSQAWSEAHRVYRQILQLTGGQGDPERVARTHTYLGEVELHLGQLDKALKRFNTALEHRQNDIKALQGVAKVLLAQGNWNSLLTVYNNIIYHAQAQSEVVDAYLTKGWVLDARMNLPEKAAQHYRKCLSLDADQPAARLRLGELALRQAAWAEAGSLSTQALSRANASTAQRAHLLLTRAIAELALGDDAAAAADYAEAVATDVTLRDRLPATAPAGEHIHAVLRERLNAAL